jgi:hypothetical protein
MLAYRVRRVNLPPYATHPHAPPQDVGNIVETPHFGLELALIFAAACAMGWEVGGGGQEQES